MVDVPIPTAGRGQVVVRTAFSLLSSGTERMVADFAGRSLAGKARARPDLVRQTLDKARREGVLAAVETVRTRLAEPMALGYASSGTVVEIGEGIEDLRPGDRVACAGGGYAVHGQFATVPATARGPAAGWRQFRVRCVRHVGCDRPAWAAPGRNSGRRCRGGDRPRPDRPTGRRPGTQRRGRRSWGSTCGPIGSRWQNGWGRARFLRKEAEVQVAAASGGTRRRCRPHLRRHAPTAIPSSWRRPSPAIGRRSLPSAPWGWTCRASPTTRRN